MPAIYHKTALATNHLNHRQNALTNQQRRLLIFIDGHKDSATLLLHYSKFGMTQIALDTLVAQAYIELRNEAQETVNHSTASTLLQDFRTKISNEVWHQLGMPAIEIVEKLESSNDTEKLLERSQKSIQILLEHGKKEGAQRIEEILSVLRTAA